MEAQLYFGQAGNDYYAVVDDQLVAVVYWSGPDLGFDDDGEIVITPAAWFWFAADEPDVHFALDAPALEPDMLEGELYAAHHAALDAAAGAILSRIAWSYDQDAENQ